jgi:hypothetical protein
MLTEFILGCSGEGAIVYEICVCWSVRVPTDVVQ